MGLTNEHEEPKILAKIKIYVLDRAELLFNLCYEIPCNWFYFLFLEVTARGSYSLTLKLDQHWIKLDQF